MSVKESYSSSVLVEPFELKRIFDLLVGGSLMLLALPLCILIALTIKITSKGPIFYVSTRVGKDYKPFRCWKFRTMCIDAKKKLQDYLEEDSGLKKEWETYLKLRKDPRTTLIGRFLRRTSLDELPQLWNVLKGELSLVGPRPYLFSEVHEIVKDHAIQILSVRPGLTGLWQVSGRNQLPFQERIRLDKEYVQRRSFLLDLNLLFKTILTIFYATGQ
jgi:undecaprenyl-phosphate galactose phosphotransferase